MRGEHKLRTAKIEEENKPAYDAEIEDFDPENKKGSFEATQFGEAGKRMSVPQGRFKLSVEGRTYHCTMLVATHFIMEYPTGE